MTRPHMYQNRHTKPVGHNPVGMALAMAKLLSKAQVQETVGILRAITRRLARSTATDLMLEAFTTSLLISQEIERAGPIKGLAHELYTCDVAVTTIKQRAMASGEWVSPTLYGQELQILQDFLRWHEAQLRVCSVGELDRCTRKVLARNAADKDPYRSSQDIGLLPEDFEDMEGTTA